MKLTIVVYAFNTFTPETMKTIKLRNGATETLYKPHEAAALLGYHPRTIRRFIASNRIKAIDSNKSGIQPVWWISAKEVERVASSLVGSGKAETKAKK